MAFSQLQTERSSFAQYLNHTIHTVLFYDIMGQMFKICLLIPCASFEINRFEFPYKLCRTKSFAVYCSLCCLLSYL